MRRSALALAAVAVVAPLSFAAPAASAAEPAFPKNASDFCREYQEFFGLTHGKCVSFFQNAQLSVELCKNSQIPSPEFANLGQCVSFLNTVFKIRHA